MRAVVAVLVALGVRYAGATVQLVNPVVGGVETGSAVEVQLHDDDGDLSDLQVLLNGTNITGRLRGTGGDRIAVLAGVPGPGNPLRRGRNRIDVRGFAVHTKTRFTWRPTMRRVRVIAIGNGLDFRAYASFATWQAEVDRLFAVHVEPQIALGRPTVVLLTEDFGLPTGLIGSRGATTRAAADQAPTAALANLLVAYQSQVQHYLSAFTLPGSGTQPAARALTLALTDTFWRAFVPALSAKARALGVYVVACTNVAPTHRSTDPTDVAMFGDVDNDSATDVFLPDGIDVYNTAFVFGPDGRVLGTTRKVNLTPPEQDLLNLSSGALADVDVLDTPAGRLGVAISLDAFVMDYVQRLNDLGATLVLQPDANPGLWATPPGEPWQPDEWTASVLGMLRPELPNLAYNATSMMVGNFFPGTLDDTGHPTGILFDGQTSVTRRTSRPPRDGFVAMAPGKELTILGEPLRGEFVGVAPWTFPDPGTVRTAKALSDLATRCATTAAAPSPAALTRDQRRRMLYACAKTLLPGAPNAGGYRESAVTADLVLPVAAP
jgi:hypothetical protein